jgi:hypothetical protein
LIEGKVPARHWSYRRPVRRSLAIRDWLPRIGGSRSADGHPACTSRGKHGVSDWIEPSGGRSGRRNHHQAHASRAHVNQSDLGCGGLGQVDCAALTEWPPVVDPHSHGLPVREVLDLHPRVEGQRLVRGGHRAHVESFTAGRQPPVVAMPVPTGNTGLGRAAIWPIRLWRGRCAAIRRRGWRREGDARHD